MMRSRVWATSWSVVRLAIAAAILAAVIAQLVKSLSTAAELGRDVATTAANFFSFFTILSNLLAAVVLLWAVAWFFTRGRSDAAAEPVRLGVALVSVSTYMIITGIVYNTLLRNIELPQGSAPIPWSNDVLHLIGPLVLLADVLIAPLRRALPWRALWIVVAFPIAWVVYTLIRGPLVTNPVTGDPFWYPYPFLNPNNPSLVPLAGYPGVAIYVVGIAAAILAVAWLVVWWGRRARRARHP